MGKKSTPFLLSHFLCSAVLLSLTTGCSLRRMAVDQTAAILKDSMPAFEKEWDIELVAVALPPNIKMVEGFLVSAPDNPDLLLMAAKAYTSYGLVILEERLDRTEEDTPQAQRLTAKTREMYLRGHRYGMRLLQLRHPGIIEAFNRGPQKLEPLLEGCEKEDVPGLIWAGMPLATAINIARDDVAMIAKVALAKALVNRAMELDETYFYGACHLVFGALYGSMGKMLGGDPDKAKKHFERALELTKRRFLLVQFMYAQTLAVQLQDQDLFKKLLGEVLEAKLEIFPEQKLANVSAKRRARLLLARMDELF
jgi:predicted anti-sigma-YlaC factor YlaD